MKRNKYRKYFIGIYNLYPPFDLSHRLVALYLQDCTVSMIIRYGVLIGFAVNAVLFLYLRIYKYLLLNRIYLTAYWKTNNSEVADEETSVLTVGIEEDRSNKLDAVDNKSAPSSHSFNGSEAHWMSLTKLFAEFSLIMMLVYICENHPLHPHGLRATRPDMFWGVCLITVLLACFSLKNTTEDLLNRHQTEEWKVISTIERPLNISYIQRDSLQIV